MCCVGIGKVGIKGSFVVGYCYSGGFIGVGFL